MNYELKVSLKLGGRMLPPGTPVSAQDLADAKVAQESIDKMLDRGQIVHISVENNPDVLRKGMKVKSLEEMLATPDPFAAPNSMMTEEVTEELEPAPKGDPEPNGEGIDAADLANADAEAALMLCLERIESPEEQALFAQYARSDEDPKDAAVRYLLANYGDRDLLRAALNEQYAEQTAVAGAAAEAGPDLKPQDDAALAADLHAQVRDTAGKDLHGTKE